MGGELRLALIRRVAAAVVSALLWALLGEVSTPCTDRYVCQYSGYSPFLVPHCGTYSKSGLEIK